jgi:predicted ATPase/transcriptional regulator with XRE-family HTH domain
MDESLPFGRWVKRLRAEHDLTQEALAELVGCAVQSVRSFESGRRRPSREMATRLAEVLGLPADERDSFVRLARGATGIAGELPSPAHAIPGVAAAPSSGPHASRAPMAPTALIGRVQELGSLRERLADPACRLITLSGPGGIGKTHLALQVARDVEAQYTHGVAWVSLAEIPSAAQFPLALAAALGCRLHGAAAPFEQVIAFQHGRRALLVLDNLEHLLEVAPLLDSLLEAAPGVQVLATSRARLNLRGEWVVTLGGLAVPPSPEAPTAARYEAVQLFVMRARQHQPSFALSPDNLAAVVRLCQLVEGMPLAIELAATWIATLTCDEIADEIAHDLDILGRSEWGAPPRHQSIRAVFEHTWRALPDDERRALLALAVFRGGWSRAAAEALVLEGEGPEPRKGHAPLRTLLAGLVDKSLVRRRDETAHTARYDMHELLRQFIVEKLSAEPAQRHRLAQRHAAFYARLVSGATASLYGSARASAWTTLRADMANVRQAWAWAVAERQVGALTQMTLGLTTICESYSGLRDGEALFTAAAATLREALGGNTFQPEEQATLGLVIGRQGYFVARCGQLGQAAALLQEAAALREGAGEHAIGDTLSHLAMVEYLRGAYSEAEAVAREGRARAEAAGDRFFAGMSINWLAWTLLARGELASARRANSDALALWRAHGNPRGLVIALVTLAELLLDEGQVDAAQQLLHESVRLSSAQADRWGIAISLWMLGRVALAQGGAEEARYLFEESAELFTELGDRLYEAQAQISLAALALDQGERTAAVRLLQGALRQAWAMEARAVALRAALALVELDEAGPEEALQTLAAIGRDPAADYQVRARIGQLQAQHVLRLPPAQAAELTQAEGVGHVGQIVVRLLGARAR